MGDGQTPEMELPYRVPGICTLSPAHWADGGGPESKGTVWWRSIVTREMLTSVSAKVAEEETQSGQAGSHSLLMAETSPQWVSKTYYGCMCPLPALILLHTWDLLSDFRPYPTIQFHSVLGFIWGGGLWFLTLSLCSSANLLPWPPKS